MKKAKRILALLGVLLLIFSLMDSPEAGNWFKASLFCTIAVPVLLYGYILIYRTLKGRGNSDHRKEEQDD